MLAIKEKCPYCQGVKRIRDDLVHYTFRHILQIENGDELWSTVITNKNEYRTMAYIEYCPKCGRKLTNNEKKRQIKKKACKNGY